MLQNEYLLAEIGFDTAENELSKVRGFLIGNVGVMLASRHCSTLS